MAFDRKDNSLFVAEFGSPSLEAFAENIGVEKIGPEEEEGALLRIDVETGEIETILKGEPLIHPLDIAIDTSGALIVTNDALYLDEICLAPPPPITAVLEERTAALPQSFLLEQNYPNPFNSSTTIRFELPRAEEIDLALYNLTGQKVATLAHGHREAGTYTLRWDGRNDDGSELASGVYLYRLRAGKVEVETRKLLLLR